MFRNGFVLQTVQNYLVANGQTQKEACTRIAKAFLGPDELEDQEQQQESDEVEAAAAEDDAPIDRGHNGPLEQLLRRAPSHNPKEAMVKHKLTREVSYVQPENIQVKDNATAVFKRAKHQRYLAWRRLQEAELGLKNATEQKSDVEGAQKSHAEAAANFKAAADEMAKAERELDDVMEDEYVYESGQVKAVTADNINDWVERVWKKMLIWNVWAELLLG